MDTAKHPFFATNMHTQVWAPSYMHTHGTQYTSWLYISTSSFCANLLTDSFRKTSSDILEYPRQWVRTGYWV